MLPPSRPGEAACSVFVTSRALVPSASTKAAALCRRAAHPRRISSATWGRFSVLGRAAADPATLQPARLRQEFSPRPGHTRPTERYTASCAPRVLRHWLALRPRLGVRLCLSHDLD